jgi:predicted dehydrogenase
MPLRLAVVGAGSIGREYSIRYLCNQAEIVVYAVVDVNLAAAEALAADIRLRYAGGSIVGGKYRETIDPDTVPRETLEATSPVISTARLVDVVDYVDIVYIATPPSLHMDIARVALSAKKHVLLEKPLAVSKEHAEIICRLAAEAFESHRVITGVHIGMRFNAAIHKIKQIIKEDPSFGRLTTMFLRLHFQQWPRVWQQQPWVAGRAEVCNHFEMIHR